MADRAGKVRSLSLPSNQEHPLQACTVVQHESMEQRNHHNQDCLHACTGLSPAIRLGAGRTVRSSPCPGGLVCAPELRHTGGACTCCSAACCAAKTSVGQLCDARRGPPSSKPRAALRHAEQSRTLNELELSLQGGAGGPATFGREFALRRPTTWAGPLLPHYSLGGHQRRQGG